MTSFCTAMRTLPCSCLRPMSAHTCAHIHVHNMQQADSRTVIVNLRRMALLPCSSLLTASQRICGRTYDHITCCDMHVILKADSAVAVSVRSVQLQQAAVAHIHQHLANSQSRWDCRVAPDRASLGRNSSISVQPVYSTSRHTACRCWTCE